MTDLDWNLIKSFVAVAESGSLSAAARMLSSSQPTIGRHVAELEARLGILLFRRGRKGFELTEGGVALLECGRGVSEQAAAFSRRAFGAVESVAGTVRITASEIVAAFVLPPILARLGEEEPGIEVEIVASNQVENLLRRDADIAIRMVKPAQNELVIRKVADLPLVACAARSYLDRRGRPEKIEDLLSHDLVGYDRYDDIIRGAGVMGIKVDRHDFRIRTDNQIVAWEAVRNGNGIGFMQKSLVERDCLVEALLPDLALPDLPMWLAMHRDVRTNRRIRRVADFLFSELKTYTADPLRP